MSHSSSYLVLCVVCQKTSSETPFNCRYRVHERNENALAQFFEKNLKNGQLCDRCYRYVFSLIMLFLTIQLI